LTLIVDERRVQRVKLTGQILVGGSEGTYVKVIDRPAEQTVGYYPQATSSSITLTLARGLSRHFTPASDGQPRGRDPTRFAGTKKRAYTPLTDNAPRAAFLQIAACGSVVHRPNRAPMSVARLSQNIQSKLRCPSCRSRLSMTADCARCLNAACTGSFPIMDGIPILINEKNSVFSIEDFVQRRHTTFVLRPTRWKTLLERLLALLPDVTLSVHANRNYGQLRDLLLRQGCTRHVLVLGGSILGEGMPSLLRDAPSIELIGTDVSFGPLTALVCDAHDIPFDDATFDGVVVQAVLEHVVDPRRCVQEIHRVLKPGGLVYAETPFMQQVHMGRYDFARFTHSGHRRLFRDFSEISSGPICGPGVALAWSYEYFLLSFTGYRVARGLLRAVARSTSFFLKYFDYYLIDKAGAYDAASAFFFLGRKEEAALEDRELIRYYKGAQLN
jgi:uncharacterized protein YbaR (Trm112 family)